MNKVFLLTDTELEKVNAEKGPYGNKRFLCQKTGQPGDGLDNKERQDDIGMDQGNFEIGDEEENEDTGQHAYIGNGGFKMPRLNDSINNGLDNSELKLNETAGEFEIENGDDQKEE